MTSKKQISKVTVDLKKNRLHVVLVGALSKKEMERLYTEIRFCVADLKPDFEIINDLTQCKLGYLSGLGTFLKVQEYLHSKGAGTVVRILSKGFLVFKQISRISDKFTKYKVYYAANLDEAEAKLTEVAQAKA